MFENLPEFSRIQKIYNEKIKEQELKLKHADHEEGAPEKWKMKFAKDDTKQRPPAKNQFGFAYESDEDEAAKNFQVKAVAAPTAIYGAASTSGMYDKYKQKSPIPKPKIEIPQVQLPLIPKGPVVLDKFGNFRLADPGALGPPKPLEPTSSTRRSRSRSRRRSSRSRSNSRSPRRRRSGSYRRRHSRSRSYSR